MTNKVPSLRDEAKSPRRGSLRGIVDRRHFVAVDQSASKFAMRPEAIDFPAWRDDFHMLSLYALLSGVCDLLDMFTPGASSGQRAAPTRLRSASLSTEFDVGPGSVLELTLRPCAVDPPLALGAALNLDWVLEAEAVRPMLLSLSTNHRAVDCRVSDERVLEGAPALCSLSGWTPDEWLASDARHRPWDELPGADAPAEEAGGSLVLIHDRKDGVPPVLLAAPCDAAAPIPLALPEYLQL